MSFRKYILFIFSTVYTLTSFTTKLQAENVLSAASDSIQTHYLASKEITVTDSIINYGKIFLDRPYRYGSPGDTTFDCSGFTSYVYRNFGYNLQRSSAEQAQQFDTVGRTHLKTGDLVYFSGRHRSKHVGHVGIVVEAKEDGNFEFIHASVQKGVTISSSTEPYYSKRFIKANRVIGGNPLLASFPYLSPSKNSSTESDNTFPVTTSVKQSTKTIPAEYHRVKRGETLASIAEKFGLTAAELKSKNGIKGNKIKPKQSLKVKDEETYTVVEPVQVASTKSEITTTSTAIQKTESSTTIASHVVKKGESLFSISKLYNITVDELKKINNIINGSIRPGQEIKLSQPTVVPEKLDIAKAEPPVKTTTHKVISGESLSSISKMYNVPVDELKKLNNLTDGKIKPGQAVKVSQPTEVAANTTTETAKPVNTAKKITHKVTEGESLYLISKNYNVSIDELKKLNNLADGKIKPGQEIKVSLPAEVAANTTTEASKPASATKVTTHRVKNGESLYLIAKNYNVSIDDLKKINNLADGKIKPGQEIKVSMPAEVAANTTTEASKPASATKITTHKVKNGESLYLIAKKYNVSIDDLKKLNNLADGKIKPRQEIKVSQQIEAVEKVTEIAKTEAPANTVKHKVTKGESLFSIAKNNNISVDELKKLNNLTTNEIKFGQELAVNQSPEPTSNTNTKAEVETKPKSVHHKIKSGESYYSIAQKFGCTMNDLKEWNLKLGSKLKIGDMLVILIKK
jgi:LysM repeat protein